MSSRRLRSFVVATAAVASTVAIAACGGDEDGGVEGVTVPDGFDVEVVVDDLDAPTQVSLTADGDLLVAQLNGGETDADGQVLRIAADDPDERELLFEGLNKPTGVVELGGDIWVMEQRRLSRAAPGGPLETVLDELPFNGRSEGTLTATADGRLLYNTSGTLDGAAPAEGSGTLWSLTPGEEPVAVATGLKNGYARTYDGEGRLWEVEMSDGRFDGEPAPDEVMLVDDDTGTAPVDFAWPRCIGDRTPVDEFGGDEGSCADTPPSLTLFDPGATPTSIAVAPWDPATLVVALWNQGRVVTVPIDDPSPDEPVANTDFLDGLDRPQHLLADGDRLLVVDFDGGRILAVTAG